MALPNLLPTIEVRRLEGGPDESTPRYWFAGDPFTSHFFNAVSSTFPEGERFFVRSVRRYGAHIDAAALAADVAAFAGQEGRHAQEHDRHVRLLIKQGYPGLAAFNRNLRAATTWLNRHAPGLSLALTAAIEHVTAITAHEILARPEVWIAGMHPSMQRLWRWHAVEETEHKSVAFDVYQQCVGAVWIRRLAMLDAVFGFLAEVFLRHAYLLIKDRQFRPRVILRGARVLFGRGGFVRLLGPQLLRFWRRDFHPWQIDDRALLEARKREWGIASAA